MLRELRTCGGLFAVLLIATGAVYPFITYEFAQNLFPEQANGSLIEKHGHVVGSSLIGQNFTTPVYFHGRPSYAGNGYDATASGASNLGPTNATLLSAIQGRVQTFKQAGYSTPLPIDLVTGSASGLDPDISPTAARLQAMHVAEARQINISKVNDLILAAMQPRLMGILGEERVNVLALNLALDEISSATPPAAQAPVSTPLPQTPIGTQAPPVTDTPLGQTPVEATTPTGKAP